MSVFDRIDYLNAQPKPEVKPEEKQVPMPRLSFDEIAAMQHDEQKLNVPVRKKPGPKPKLSGK